MGTSKLYEHGANRRIFNIDTHVGMAAAGLVTDARQLAEIARDEASSYRSDYGSPIKLPHLTQRVSSYMHAHTLYSFVRPFGATIMLGTWSKEDGAEMMQIEPSGVGYGYWGCAAGKDKMFELELSWVGEFTDGVHKRVPEKVQAEAEKYAKSAMEEDSDSDEDMS